MDGQRQQQTLGAEQDAAPSGSLPCPFWPAVVPAPLPSAEEAYATAALYTNALVSSPALRAQVASWESELL